MFFCFSNVGENAFDENNYTDYDRNDYMNWQIKIDNFIHKLYFYFRLLAYESGPTFI